MLCRWRLSAFEELASFKAVVKQASSKAAVKRLSAVEELASSKAVVKQAKSSAASASALSASSRSLLYSCFTHSCFTPALLLLYYCFTLRLSALSQQAVLTASCGEDLKSALIQP